MPLPELDFPDYTQQNVNQHFPNADNGSAVFDLSNPQFGPPFLGNDLFMDMADFGWVS
jgi:hypothetical protein